MPGMTLLLWLLSRIAATTTREKIFEICKFCKLSFYKFSEKYGKLRRKQNISNGFEFRPFTQTLLIRSFRAMSFGISDITYMGVYKRRNLLTFSLTL
jgi:hypothetical protein